MKNFKLISAWNLEKKDLHLESEICSMSLCQYPVWFLEEPSLSLVCLSGSLDLERKRWLYSLSRPFPIPLQDYLWITQGWHGIVSTWPVECKLHIGLLEGKEVINTYNLIGVFSRFLTSHLGWSIGLSSQLLAELGCSEWNRKKSA